MMVASTQLIRITSFEAAPTVVDKLLANRDGLKNSFSFTADLEEEILEDDVEDSDSETGSTASHNSETSRDRRIRLHAEESDRRDKRMAILCQPFTRLLEAIDAAGGSLLSFTWRIDSETKGVRPVSFWEALYKHARTLEEVEIVFHIHETSDTPAPQVVFPALKCLKIDASSSHGCDGTAVHALLKNSPNLETLSLKWPCCDLVTCQITNLTWDYSFSKLKHLSLDGHDLSINALTDFLGRCPSIVSLQDRAEYNGDIISDEEGPKMNPNVRRQLATTALPNLHTLKTMKHETIRSLSTYLNPVADRPIKSLTFQGGWGATFNMGEIAQMPVAPVTSRIEELTIEGSICDWRMDPPTDSDDEEDHRKYEEAGGLSHAMRALKTTLRPLTGLKRLALGMDSENVAVWQPGGNWIYPPAMRPDDVKDILDQLLQIQEGNSAIETLSMKDGRAKKLPEDALVGMRVPDGLKFLEWNASSDEKFELICEHGIVKRLGKIESEAGDS